MPTGRIFMADVPSRTDLWLPVTLRVAWELHTSGFRVRAQILDCAREHVLRSLPPDVQVEQAERLASIYTSDFVDRFQNHRYHRPTIEDDLNVNCPLRWRHHLEDKLDSVSKVVFRFHFRDGFSLESVSARSAIPMKRIVKSRNRLHSLLRRIAQQDGKDFSTWSETRLDLLLSRVANVAEDNDLSPEDILSEEGRALVNICPRINRAYRLLRHGIISINDLHPPEGTTIPTGRKSLLSLMLHPDARQHSSLLKRALVDYAISISGDAWLIPQDKLPEVHAALAYLSEVNTPARHHLRGALVSGPGRIFKGVFLGPLPVRALEATRARPWGELDGIAELPPPLPPPPKSQSWWVGAALSLIVGIWGLLWATTPEMDPPTYPMRAEFYVNDQDVRVRFDVDDNASLSILTLAEGDLNVVYQNLGTEKGVLATGDGRYLFRGQVDDIIVISSAMELDALHAWAQVSQADIDPLQSLKDMVLKTDPKAMVVISPAQNTEEMMFSSLNPF